MYPTHPQESSPRQRCWFDQKPSCLSLCRPAACAIIGPSEWHFTFKSGKRVIGTVRECKKDWWHSYLSRERVADIRARTGRGGVSRIRNMAFCVLCQQSADDCYDEGDELSGSEGNSSVLLLLHSPLIFSSSWNNPGRPLSEPMMMTTD